MRHYAKPNPFSNFLWIKDELLWNHSRWSCQNELVQQSFLWIIFHDSFTATVAVRVMQELSQQIFLSFLVPLITLVYWISNSKLSRKKKDFLVQTFDKYLLMVNFKPQFLCEQLNWRWLNSCCSCLLGFSLLYCFGCFGVLTFCLFIAF